MREVLQENKRQIKKENNRERKGPRDGKTAGNERERWGDDWKTDSRYSDFNAVKREKEINR